MDENKICLSVVLEVYAIKRKTTAKLFKNLRTGSRIKITHNITAPTYGYATEVTLENLDTKEKVTSKLGKVCQAIDAFSFVEIKE